MKVPWYVLRVVINLQLSDLMVHQQGKAELCMLYHLLGEVKVDCVITSKLSSVFHISSGSVGFKQLCGLANQSCTQEAGTF